MILNSDISANIIIKKMKQQIEYTKFKASQHSNKVPEDLRFDSLVTQIEESLTTNNLKMNTGIKNIISSRPGKLLYNFLKKGYSTFFKEILSRAHRNTLLLFLRALFELNNRNHDLLMSIEKCEKQIDDITKDLQMLRHELALAQSKTRLVAAENTFMKTG